MKMLNIKNSNYESFKEDSFEVKILDYLNNKNEIKEMSVLDIKDRVIMVPIVDDMLYFKKSINLVTGKETFVFPDLYYRGESPYDKALLLNDEYNISSENLEYLYSTTNNEFSSGTNIVMLSTQYQSISEDEEDDVIEESEPQPTLDLVSFSLSDVTDMIRVNQITCPLTISAIYYIQLNSKELGLWEENIEEEEDEEINF